MQERMIEAGWLNNKDRWSKNRGSSMIRRRWRSSIEYQGRGRLLMAFLAFFRVSAPRPRSEGSISLYHPFALGINCWILPGFFHFVVFLLFEIEVVVSFFWIDVRTLAPEVHISTETWLERFSRFAVLSILISVWLFFSTKGSGKGSVVDI